MSKCDWGLHKWPRWSEPVIYNGVRVHTRTLQEYNFTVYLQERTCERCGLHQKEEVKTIS